jgi:hypothetical protein
LAVGQQRLRAILNLLHAIWQLCRWLFFWAAIPPEGQRN